MNTKKLYFVNICFKMYLSILLCYMLGHNNVSSKASPYNYQGNLKIIGVALLIADTPPANSATMELLGHFSVG